MKKPTFNGKPIDLDKVNEKQAENTKKAQIINKAIEKTAPVLLKAFIDSKTGRCFKSSFKDGLGNVYSIHFKREDPLI